MTALQPFAVLATIAAFTLAGLFVLLWEWRVAARLRRERVELEVLLDTRRQETRTAVELAVRAGRRLKKAEHQLKQLTARLDSLELHGNDRSQTYDQAINLVRRGADSGKLVSNFGLSHSEAELVTLLHGKRKAS